MSYQCHMSSSYNLVQLLHTERWARRIMNKENTTKCADQCQESRDWCDRRDICETSCKTIWVSVGEVTNNKCNQCEFAFSQADNLTIDNTGYIYKYTQQKKGKSFFEKNMVVQLYIYIWLFSEKKRVHWTASSSWEELVPFDRMSSIVSQASSACGQKRLKEVAAEQILHFIV